ncbi:enoyl-CoA hydratase-related protein [Arthrobacter sp. E44]|uniref:enoyl-CoA hydratase-related protein n=1 Tax=Arthrobacter sp. E44 TaxID=3341794 RepID=UPI0035A5FD9B
MKETAFHSQTISIKGSGAGNVLGGAFWDEFGEVLSLIVEEGRASAVVLRGEGAAFSHGLDLRWYLTRLRRAARRGASATSMAGDIDKLQAAVNLLADCPLPTVAVIDGDCVGAALELVTACDIRYATQRSWFAMPEADLGLVADLGGLQRLPKLIGEGHVREIVLSGGRFSAAHAERIGLVNSSYAHFAELQQQVDRFLKSIDEKPRTVIAAIKETLSASARGSISDGLRFVREWNVVNFENVSVQRRVRARLTDSSANT